MTPKDLYEKARGAVFSPAVLIPLLSALAYIIAYAFETAHLAYFGISHQFVEITVNVFILSLCGSLVIFIYLAALAVQLPDVYSELKNHPRKLVRNLPWQYLFTTSPLLLGVLAAGVYFEFGFLKTILLVLLTTLFILAVPLLGMLFNRLLKEPPKNASHTASWSRQLRPYMQLLLYATLGLVVAGSVGFIAGRQYAGIRTSFSVYTWHNSRYVVVRSYPDHMLLTSIDEHNKLSGKATLILETHGDSPIELGTIKPAHGLK
jgi:hypothetical protein